MSVFKDFQALKIWREKIKKFKDFQGPARALPTSIANMVLYATK